MTALEIWYEGINQVWYKSHKNYQVTLPDGSKVVVVDGLAHGDTVMIINGDEYHRVKVKIPAGIFSEDKTKFILAAHGQEGDRRILEVLCTAPLEPVTFKFSEKKLDGSDDDRDDEEKDTNGQIIVLDPPDPPTDF